MGMILKSLMAVITKLLISLGSEKIIEWAFFYLSEQIVKTTKTKHDDLFFEEVKKAYKSES